MRTKTPKEIKKMVIESINVPDDEWLGANQHTMKFGTMCMGIYFDHHFLFPDESTLRSVYVLTGSAVFVIFIYISRL